jgi:hypothetical protein
MIFWMRRTARHLKAELHGRLDAALALGGVALVLTAFLAVGLPARGGAQSSQVLHLHLPARRRAARSGRRGAITATDSNCEVATTSLPAGRTTFAGANKGLNVTEVYV